MNQPAELPPSPVHQNHKHESAYRHTSGAAEYIDDLHADLVTLIFLSPVARAHSLVVSTEGAIGLPGRHS